MKIYLDKGKITKIEFEDDGYFTVDFHQEENVYPIYRPAHQCPNGEIRPPFLDSFKRPIEFDLNYHAMSLDEKYEIIES